MKRRTRSLQGTSVVAAAAPGTALTFPAALIQPPQSQVTRSEDAVSNRVSQLDLRAQQLGEGFGIAFTTFLLNPLDHDISPQSNGWKVAAAMLRELAHRAERVSLERRGGRWGLYFTREPAALAQERGSLSVPLKDAPLDVRERFLVRSEAFFREYLALCEGRLGSMKTSIAYADRTLKLLDEMQLA